MEDTVTDKDGLRTIVTKSFLERVFLTLLEDIHGVSLMYYNQQITQSDLMEFMDVTVKNLHELSERGELQKILNRAELVILEGALKDIQKDSGTEFANS